MIIGVPKEIMKDEKRVSSSPDTVRKMIQKGHEVLVETNAGMGSFYTDEAYVEAGAKILPTAKEVFEKAEVILKVKEPQFNVEHNTHEVDLMHEGQTLITFIHPAAPVNHEMVKNMAKKGITSITLDGIPRISRAQSMDALTSMSTCAGYKGLILAANHLSHFVPQIFTAVGMVKPINSLIIGAGVGGLQAIATAKRLGSIVYAADIRPDAAEQATSLGAKLVDLEIPAELAVGEGGYALSLSEENLEREREILKKHLPNMDIVFLSALVPGKEAPILITEEMVKLMKPGSVIVDISIDQGGNCAITPPGTTEVKHNVTIIGIKNLPGHLAKSATWMFSQNIYNVVDYLIKDNKIVMDFEDPIIIESLTTYKGEVVHKGALEAMK